MNADKLYHMKCRAIAYAPAVPPRVRFGSMLSINVFRGASEQHCFKIGVRRATLIQKTRHLDSIIARLLLVADFIDSIDPKPTFRDTLPLPPANLARVAKTVRGQVSSPVHQCRA